MAQFVEKINGVRSRAQDARRYGVRLLDHLLEQRFRGRADRREHFQSCHSGIRREGADFLEHLAGAVGVACCAVYGPEDRGAAFPLAETLGLALQQINIMRDVAEDWRLGRVYLPQDELERFGVTETSDIALRIAALVGVFVVSIVASIFAYLWIEEPARKFIRKLELPKRAPAPVLSSAP